MYKQLAGSIMYLTATRPDIAFSTTYISRFMESPKYYHWKAGKRVLRYIIGTSKYGLSYAPFIDSKLIGYTDNCYAGCIDDQKSTSRYAFLFGRTWSSGHPKSIP